MVIWTLSVESPQVALAVAVNDDPSNAENVVAPRAQPLPAVDAIH